MTTSITDARYNVIHHTPSYTLALGFDDTPESGWSVMPGYDESLNVPAHLEPPRTDADEVLPSMLHPSYPYGRPMANSKKRGKRGGVGNLLGTLGLGSDLRGGTGSASASGMIGREWDEWALGDVVEREKSKEVPPGMAGAKRPPSPPSPALRPSQLLPVRSGHLRRLLERQQTHRQSPPMPTDGFDAPVPNETYDEEQPRQGTQQAQTQGQQVQGQGQGQARIEGQRQGGVEQSEDDVEAE